jgi:hypothetical protein
MEIKIWRTDLILAVPKKTSKFIKAVTFSHSNYAMSEQLQIGTSYNNSPNAAILQIW